RQVRLIAFQPRSVFPTLSPVLQQGDGLLLNTDRIGEPTILCVRRSQGVQVHVVCPAGRGDRLFGIKNGIRGVPTFWIRTRSPTPGQIILHFWIAAVGSLSRKGLCLRGFAFVLKYASQASAPYRYQRMLVAAELIVERHRFTKSIFGLGQPALHP